MTRPLSSAFRRALVWLLAGLLPLQALAAVVIGVAGPSHVHAAPTAAQLVLDDFRRSPVRAEHRETHIAGAWGHVHDGGAAQRHPHLPGDATVVVDGHEAQQAADAADLSGGASLGSLCGFVSSPPAWGADGTDERPVPFAHWAPRTHHPALPERPPRVD